MSPRHKKAVAKNLEKARAAKAAKRANGNGHPTSPFTLQLDADTARELYVRLKMDEPLLGTRLRIVSDTLAAQAFSLPGVDQS